MPVAEARAPGLGGASPRSPRQRCAVYGVLCLHADSPLTLESFAACLSSALEQRSALDRLFVSWSASPELGGAAAAKVRDAERAGAAAGVAVTSVRHSARRCAAEAMRGLLPLAVAAAGATPRPAWLLLSGQDVWHPRRVAVYRSVCEESEEQDCILAAGRHLERLEGPLYQGPLHLFPADAAQVDALLTQKALRVVEWAQDFWALCVRPSVLEGFYESYPEAVWSHRFGEMALARYADPQCNAQWGRGVREVHAPDGCWMYCSLEQGASEDRAAFIADPRRDRGWRCLRVTAEDEALAQLPALRALAEKKGGADFLPAAVAALRSDAECFIISQRGGGVRLGEKWLPYRWSDTWDTVLGLCVLHVCQGLQDRWGEAGVGEWTDALRDSVAVPCVQAAMRRYFVGAGSAAGDPLSADGLPAVAPPTPACWA